MDNSLVSVFIFIFVTKANNQDPTEILTDQPFMNMDLQAIENESHTHHLSTEDKKKIMVFLKSFTSSVATPSVNIISDATKYCKSFKTCKECSKSKWFSCVWCHDYGCTDRPEKLCPFAQTNRNLLDSNSTSNHRLLCPYVEHEGTILVPAGIRHNLQLKIHTTDPILYEKEIICQLRFTNRVSHLKALILDDVVYCYPVKLDTEIEGQSNKGSLRLIWGGAQPFSNRVPVTVYRCEYLASDCESCKLIPLEYGCGWCAELNKCVIADKCTDLLIWNVNRLTCKSLGKKMLYV